MKFPGTYYAYAGILAAFGESTRGVHLGLLVVNVLTTGCLWLVARRLLGELGAVATVWAWAVLSVDRWIMGIFAHATHFVVLPVVAALWLLLVGAERRGGQWFVAGGVLLGIAMLMKQHAVVFIVFGAGLAFWSAWRDNPRHGRVMVRRTAAVLGGACVPFAVWVATAAGHGVFEKFWFWTIDYAREYVRQVPLARAPARLAAGLREVTRATLPLWLAAAGGLVALWVGRWHTSTRVVITGLLVTAFLAVCPGLFFREHYFIVMLPAVALLVGVAVESLERLVGRVAPPTVTRATAVVTLVGVIGAYGVTERRYLFAMPAAEISRSRYGTNPFVEAPVVAAYLRQHTGEGDRIAVLGSEPQIYFLSGRRSATGYIYTYPLVELQPFARRMQEEMRREIEAAHPAYVVFVKTRASWLARPGSDQWIIGWGLRYLGQCYDLVGIADVSPSGASRYVWEKAAVTYRPVSDSVLYVFRRKGDAPCAVKDP